MTRRSILALLQATSRGLRPIIDGPWIPIAGPPELGRFDTPKREVVDFAIWPAADASWQIWSCIRHTAEAGATRLFHRWQGPSPAQPGWNAMGIAMRADPSFGEREGSLQAPYVIRLGAEYRMYYTSGGRCFVMTSFDGKTFSRLPRPDGKNFGVFRAYTGANPEVGFAGAGGRDIMLLRHEGKWIGYYTANTENEGRVYARTSTDLWTWDSPREVAFGGESGSGPISSECPHVVRGPDQAFYLFRTQHYKTNPETRVYRSSDPFAFGLNDDRYLVAKLPVAAPEIFDHEGQTYIAALQQDLQGIRAAKLRFA
jgi:hypothetical protein